MVISGIPDRDLEPHRFAAAAAAWGFPRGVPGELAESAIEYFADVEHRQPPFRQMMDQVRVGCFGTNSTDLLMWSHYADGLRGFCLGFDEDDLRRGAPEAYITDVEYLEVPPMVDSFVYAVADDQYDFHLTAISEGDALQEITQTEDPFRVDYQVAADEALETMHQTWRLIFAAKPLEWKYERERRMLLLSEASAASFHLHRYMPCALREVIVGDRMTAQFRKKLLKAVTTCCDGVRLSVAKRNEGSYRLSIAALEH